MKTMEEKAKEFIDRIPFDCSQFREDLEYWFVRELMKQRSITRSKCLESLDSVHCWITDEDYIVFVKNEAQLAILSVR